MIPPEIAETYEADVSEQSSVFTEEELEHRHFIHPQAGDEHDMCYAALGLVRYNTNMTLSRGQVIPFCNPMRGWYNSELEFVLFIMLARVTAESGHEEQDRFNFFMSGRAGYGTDNMHAESAIYRYRADSVMGFLGTEAHIMHPVVRTDIDALTTYAGYIRSHPQLRRQDGSLDCMPKFYRRSPLDVPGRTTSTLFNLETKAWDHFTDLEDTGPVILPFHKHDENCEDEQVALIGQMGAADIWDGTIYIGSDSMRIGTKEMAETRYDTTHGYDTMCQAGVKPDWEYLTRFSGSERARHAGLARTLNAFGVRAWQNQLRRLKNNAKFTH